MYLIETAVGIIVRGRRQGLPFESDRLLCRLGVEVIGEVAQINHRLSPDRAMQTLDHQLDPACLDFAQQVAVSADVSEVLFTHR